MYEPRPSQPQPGAPAASGTANVSRAPGSASASSPRQAQAGMPSRRGALDTGARGWRWLVTASLLALPLLCAAAEPDHRFLDGGALLAEDATVTLGSPLATRAQAADYLHAAARAPVAAPAWIDVYFGVAAPQETTRYDGDAFVAVTGTSRLPGL